jgi:predicted acylesterase/phospholipase RssA
MAKTPYAPQCDLVLEGGVTSALIYIGLITKLSQTYVFRRLGGSSSGAIAAAAGAIAQRANLEGLKPTSANVDANAAFAGLADFPKVLSATNHAGDTVLFKLFQAQAGTRRCWHIVAAALKHKHEGVLRTLWHMLLALFAQFPLPAVLGAVLGLVPALWLGLQGGALSQWATAYQNNPKVMTVALLVALTSAFLSAVVCALVFGLISTARGLSRNHFGLCNGMKGADFCDPTTALTPQLHTLFQKLLDKAADDEPVVFAALWGAAALHGGEREIDLQMITTALNLRRPYRIPNDPGVDPLESFMYDPQEWAQLFPASVMAWLEKHRRLPEGPAVRSGSGALLHALPKPAQWPVIVAARLSLSFPGLLSAVPMYWVEPPPPLSNPPGQTASAFTFVARRVYFTDGGVTSNLPLQLFDAPLPSRPTFAVRLDEFDPRYKRRIWLPMDALEPPPRVYDYNDKTAAQALWSFAMSLINTMLSWRDKVQRDLPGYRERVAVVGLRPDEGGLNLAMNAKTILRLARLGERAALRLHLALGGVTRLRREDGWQRHRWIRLRATLAATQEHLQALRKALLPRPATTQAPTTPSFQELLQQSPTPEPRFVDRPALAQAQALVDQVAAGLLTDPIDPNWPPRQLDDNAPKPRPRLRMNSPW